MAALVAAFCTAGAVVGAAPEMEKTLVVLIRNVLNTNALPSVATIEGRMATVNSNFLEYSYDKQGFCGVENPGKAADVFGWYDYDGLGDYELNVATNVDFRQYDTMVVIVATKPGSHMAAYASIGKVFTLTPDGTVYMGWTHMSVGNASVGILSHELGHTQGFGESCFYDCGDEPLADTGSWVDYGEPYDVMSSMSIGHPNARLKEYKGWLGVSSGMVEVVASGRYNIEPIESNTGGIKALKIPRRAGEQCLYIEYRQRIGTDAAFDPAYDVLKGALFHYGSYLINMTPPALPYAGLPTDAQLTPTLHPGQSYTDPITGHGYTVVSATADLLTIDINHSGYECNPPVVEMLAPPADSFISGQFPLSAHATDDTEMVSVEFRYRKDFSTLALCTVSNPAPAGMVYTTSFDSARSMPNGAGQLLARAYDQYGNYADSAPVDVVVSNATDITPPTLVIDVPTAGTTIASNNITVRATAADDQHIWKVELYANGNTHSPIYSVISTSAVHTAAQWFQSGPNRVSGRVWDFEGNTGAAAEVSFFVIDDTDTVAPWGYFTLPADNAVLSYPVQVAMDAGDNVGVTSVTFLRLDSVDEADPMLVCTNAPYGFPFDCTSVSTGFHMFRAVISDAATNKAWAQVMFTVERPTDPPAAPGAVSASDGTFRDRVRIGWESVLGSQTYEVWRNTTADSALADKVGETAAPTFDDMGAASGRVYTYWIKARNMVGASAFSAGDQGFASKAARSDYDGDGVSDLAVYDNNTGAWYAYSLSNLSAVAWGFSWGWPGALPQPGDFDGDGAGDPAVFDSTTGAWYIRSLAGTVIGWAVPWGWPGAQPVPGDFNGDSIGDLAVFDQNTGYWYILALDGTVVAWATPWGWPGAWPVSGDYDGDGRSDLAVFDQNTGYWYILALDGTVVAWATPWGWPGAVPVSGDYDGDGRSDLAVFDTISGYWYIWSATQGTVLAWATPWGWSTAVPVSGDYDGDRTSDLAVFDNATGCWYIWSLDAGLLAWQQAWGWVGATPVGAAR